MSQFIEVYGQRQVSVDVLGKRGARFRRFAAKLGAAICATANDRISQTAMIKGGLYFARRFSRMNLSHYVLIERVWIREVY